MEFKEVQQLKLWWLYVLIGLETIVIGSVLFLSKHALTLEQLRETYFAPIFAMLFPFVLIFLLQKFSFKYYINEQGIRFQYWPFTKLKHIYWNEMEKLYIRKYDALGEYGGWGIKSKLWFKKNDKAYIFNSEDRGLQLILKNGNKLLFSTNKPEELRLFLINLKRNLHLDAIENDVR